MPVVKLNLDDLRMRAAREELEQLLLERALGQAQGNVSSAADLLGVARPTVYSLMRKFGLHDPGTRQRLNSEFLDELRSKQTEHALPKTQSEEELE